MILYTIMSGKNWHEGVIGIVAARLKDKFNKPVILISLDGNVGNITKIYSGF